MVGSKFTVCLSNSGVRKNASKFCKKILRINTSIINVGDTIKAVGTITDVYEKTGRTGTMVFVVNQTEYFNQDNVLVATRQASMVHREVESE